MLGKLTEPLISQRGLDYLAARGFNAERAAARFSLFTCHDPNGGEPTRDETANFLGIPYMRGFDVAYVQFRDMRPDVPHKDRYRSPKGSKPAIFNVDALNDPGLDGKPVTICEGALDAIATTEAGAQRVIGLPGTEFSGLIEDAIDDFEDVRQIILAGHADGAGQGMNDKLAAILTPYRCKTVGYPAPDGDMNETLLNGGAAAVLATLKSAQAIKVQGVYRPREAPKHPPRQVLRVTRFGPDVAQHIGICKRQLSIWTGLPNDGKTTFLKAYMWALMGEHGTRPAAAFFEEDFNPDTINDLWALQHMRPYVEEQDEAALWDWLDPVGADFPRWTAIEGLPRNADDQFRIQDFLEAAKVAVARGGADILIADPFSEFDTVDPRVPETEMIRRSIISLRNFARDFNVHVALVAHPKKHGDYGGTTKIADGNDVAGSLHFNGRCDLGVTVARDPVADGVALISVWKVRKKDMGCRGVFPLLFDRDSGRYLPMTKDELADARGETGENVIDFNKRKPRRVSAAASRRDING